MKYRMALDERPTAVTTELQREQRHSEAAFTHRAPSAAKNKSQLGHESVASKSAKTKENRPKVAMLDCNHVCRQCCLGCKTLNSGTQVITLAIQSSTKCNCASKKQLATPSNRSINGKEKDYSRTGTFGIPGQKVTSPPSRKSSVASRASVQGGKEQGLYDLMHSQNQMIRQITSELTKQRDITQEIEKGLRTWKGDLANSDERRVPSPDIDIRNERDFDRLSAEEKPRIRPSVSQKSESQRSLNNQRYENEKQLMGSVRHQSAASVENFKTTSFQKSYHVEQPKRESPIQNLRCKSTESHIRKTSSMRLPHSGNSEFSKDKAHHQRCCLAGSKKKVAKKPKTASQHIYTLTHCGSACKHPILPFSNTTVKARVAQTARKPKVEPRSMYPVHRKPSAVIDALADIVARRLKVELKP